MPHRHRDELSKLDDVEALVTTARDLVTRFKEPDLRDVGLLLHQALRRLDDARLAKIARWKRERSAH